MTSSAEVLSPPGRKGGWIKKPSALFERTIPPYRRQCGREFPSGVGQLSIGKYRMSLRRSGDVQRTADREVFSVVVQVVHLVRIEIERRSVITNEGVVVPAVPKTTEDVDDEFPCPGDSARYAAAWL
jgi:hypothetical protein